MSHDQIDELRERSETAIRVLRSVPEQADLDNAAHCLRELRDERQFDLMQRLAEAISRHEPKDAGNRTLFAQSLVENGLATVAVDVLRPIVRTVPKSDPQYGEATGLLGRAYKQIFFDAGDKTSPAARDALKNAIAAYRLAYELNPASHTWHAANITALLTCARGMGLRVAPELHPRKVASSVVQALSAQPPRSRDAWWSATMAEASLGLGDWDAVELNLRDYITAPSVKAFHISSTLRQLTEVWDLDASDERGRGLVEILRAQLLRLSGGAMQLAPGELDELRRQPAPEKSQLEAVLGLQGPETYRWWKTGLDRARSVASIRRRLGDRIGTGFLIQAGAVNLEPSAELLVMTNFHVVNEFGVSPGARPDEAEVMFEAEHPDRHYTIGEIVWTSPIARHDCTILRLEEQVEGLSPMPLANSLPIINETARVYIIGHPGGHELAFSFQDNELLDHEGPPKGNPQIPGVCRVHYRAPTKGGSSGSPVFNKSSWEIIALHHSGGRIGMPRLNGQPGDYAANEGISLNSIRDAIAAYPKGL